MNESEGIAYVLSIIVPLFLILFVGGVGIVRGFLRWEAIRRQHSKGDR